MLTIYGSMLCKDCVQCREDLDKAGISYTYLDFADDLANLKTFLHLRDTQPVFSDVRREGKIGIPCIVDSHGTVCLDWQTFM